MLTANVLSIVVFFIDFTFIGPKIDLIIYISAQIRKKMIIKITYTKI